jgi:predicted nucleic acid-binding protein
LDTNVLVALADEHVDLHVKAIRDLKRLGRGPFATTTAVLTEACFLASAGYLRRRIRALLKRLDIAIVDVPPDDWEDIFDWLERYEEHAPDLADAHLVGLSARDPARRVWTYDREFRSIWRRPDGSRVPTTPR